MFEYTETRLDNINTWEITTQSKYNEANFVEHINFRNNDRIYRKKHHTLFDTFMIWLDGHEIYSIKDDNIYGHGGNLIITRDLSSLKTNWRQVGDLYYRHYNGLMWSVLNMRLVIDNVKGLNQKEFYIGSREPLPMRKFGIKLQKDIIEDVIKERKRQDDKWGADRDLDPGLWSLILSEEVGEVSNAFLEMDKDIITTEAYDELVQVAATAVAWAEAEQRRLTK